MGRRGFLKATGVAVVTTAAGVSVGRLRQGGPALGLGAPAKLTGAPTRQFYLAGTDGWASLGDPAVIKGMPPFWPDPAAPTNYDLWIMGFTDLLPYAAQGSGVDVNKVFARRQRAQLCAPLIYMDEGENLAISLRNLGLAMRPDLVDGHTVHFHGFPNQVPYFDGVPDTSLAAPINRELVYEYLPQDPGTYMYHCHFEDVEHVHMGLQGMVFVRPKGQPNWAYNDSSTAFTRQFSIHIEEIDVQAHYNDAHVQVTDWSAYAPSFRTMNGRTYPDTLVPNYDVNHPAAYSSTDLPPPTIAHPPNYPARLVSNPLSSVIQANQGEVILIRVSNLGYKEYSLTLPGIPMKIIGEDAKRMTPGRLDYFGYATRADATRTTNVLDLGPGESRDVLFTAPAYAGGSGTTLPGNPDVYPFYDRGLNFDTAAAATGTVDGYGGMRTEVRIYPGTLPQQTDANGNNVPHKLVNPI